jgi:hypothetical protein
MMGKVRYSMKFSNLTRTGTALVAGAALFAAFPAGADATPSNTFNVSTTISASCVVTDSGPADLTPTYIPSTNSGVGSATSLDTNCSGSSPTVTFTDAANTGTSEFVMTSGSNNLFYQISDNSSCNGAAGDNPIQEGVAQSLLSGTQSYEICAAVITGGAVNVAVAAGSYTDTVTYTFAPQFRNCSRCHVRTYWKRVGLTRLSIVPSPAPVSHSRPVPALFCGSSKSTPVKI